MQPSERGGRLSAHDPRLAPWRAFVRAQAYVSRRLDDDLRAEHGLSLQEYGALLILAESPGRRLRMGRLADSLTLSKSGATRLIDRLVYDGFVGRLSCSSDARGAEAELTETGLDRLRAAAPTHLRGIADYFLAAIDGSDLEVVERTMAHVAEHAQTVAGASRCLTGPAEHTSSPVPARQAHGSAGEPPPVGADRARH